MKRRYSKLTGWKYRGKGEVISEDQSIATVECVLVERVYMFETGEMGNRQPLVGVDRKEIRGRITVIGDDKDVLSQFTPPLDLHLLDLEDRRVVRITHRAARNVPVTSTYDVVEFK